MRILALTNLFPNPYQPQRAPFNRLQIRELAAEHDVRVIAPILWTDERAARRRAGTLVARDRHATCDGIAVEHARYWFPPRMLRGWYGRCFAWSVRGAFRRAVSEFRPDLLFASWAYPDGWAAIRLGREAGLPVVVKVHGSDILEVERYPGRVRPTVEAMRTADGIVAVSRDLAERVVSLGADRRRVRVIYNGIDGEVFCPGGAAEARTRLGLAEASAPAVPMLLAVGNLVPVKGHDVLIAACSLLAAAGRPVHCYIIGQGPLRGKLQEQATALGLGRSVTFVGSVAHDRVADWLRASTLLVLPSRSEGVPNVLLEASACGTPYVASRVGGVPEITRPGAGRLVPPGDPGALAHAIEDSLAEAAALQSDGTSRPGTTGNNSGRPHAVAARELGEFLAHTLAERHRLRSPRPQFSQLASLAQGG